MRSVALLPSTQRAEGAYPYLEGREMKVIAELARDLILCEQGYDAAVFWPGFDPESADRREEQLEAAELWLRTRVGRPEERVLLRLETSSGVQSRVTAISDERSDDLAQALVASVARSMKTSRTGVWQRAEEPGAQPCYSSALLVLGSRNDVQNALVLVEQPEAVAIGLVGGLRRYFDSLLVPSGTVWCEGMVQVVAPNAAVRTSPSREGRVMRVIGKMTLATDGYTERGQLVAGSRVWYHLARQSGYGWLHSSAGRYFPVVAKEPRGWGV